MYVIYKDVLKTREVAQEVRTLAADSGDPGSIPAPAPGCL